MSPDPTGHSLLAEALRALEAAGLDAPRAEARLLLAAALEVPLSRLDLHLAAAVGTAAAARMGALVQERASRRPLAYVLGETEFMGLRFRCDPRALIPRPETELLVEEVLARLPREAGQQLVLDLGAGTGAIGLSLAALRPGLVVVLTDVSPGALTLAQENAASLGLSDRVRFLPGPDLDPVLEAGLAGEITHLVSNPPYVAPRDVPDLPPEVALHEPSVAWRGEGEEGTGCYGRIVPRCPRALPRLRLAAFEVGIGQAATVAALCRSAWPAFGVSTRRDLSGIERIVIAEAPDA